MPTALNDLLKATSRSFYLTLRVLPARVRLPIPSAGGATDNSPRWNRGYNAPANQAPAGAKEFFTGDFLPPLPGLVFERHTHGFTVGYFRSPLRG